VTDFIPTPEQRSIIEYPPVPLRVAAGAGTGKTTTIVKRLAAAVEDGGDPTRALGITFTNKAADELRIRLRESVGDRDDGSEVEVGTYHSFASSILDEFGAFVGYEPTATLMDDGHRTELAYRVLHDLDATDLDLSALAQRKKELLTVSEALTANLLSADDVERVAPDDLDDVWRTRSSLMVAAERFAAAKQRLGFLEYADLISLAVTIVEEFPEIADRIARRYDTVLLDEYQDTDPAQRRLLTAIFARGTAVTAVGDSDQTIYEWRGASLENFEDFPIHFQRADGEETETLPLSVNRRSDRAILNLANTIQTRIPRLEGSEELRPGPDAEEGSVTVGWFSTDHEEAAWIAEEIHERRAEGVGWSDIAILARKRATIRPIVRALRDAGIPYAVSSMGELLTVGEVSDLVAWMRVLADPGDEPYLMRIWMGGRFRIGMRDISKLARWCKRNETSDLAIAVEHLDAVQGLSPSGRARLEEYASIHTELHALAQVLPVSGIVTAIVDRLGLWDEIAALPTAAGTTARINIGRFVTIANAWVPLDGNPTLAAFIRYLTALDDAAASSDLDAAIDVADSVVQVITAHTAKGLEWPVVFLPSLADGTFPSNVREFDEPSKRATSMPYEVRLDSSSFTEASAAAPGKDRDDVLRARHNNAEWRLAYVAVTRAKHDLILTGHAWDEGIKRARTPSPLLTIAHELECSTVGPWTDDPGPKPELVAFVEQPSAPDPHLDQSWAETMRMAIEDPGWIASAFPDIVDAVENERNQLIMQIADLKEPTVELPPEQFSTSVTNLVAMAECPRKFKWIHYDRLPRRPGIAAQLGTRFHRKVEYHNLGVVSLDEPVFETVHTEPAGGEPVSQRTDPWDAFTESRFVDLKATFSEVPFVLEIAGGMLRGKIDAIYTENDDSWEIVDYKSGKRRDDAARKVQLEAYALAIADGTVSVDPPEAMTVTFAYFGGGICDEDTVVVDDAWMSDARSHVGSLMNAAEEGPFEPSPSAACRYCDFLHLCEQGRTEVDRERRSKR
jgi:DNA helicase-2/ATP-dependent DNA helicase PcrA